MKIFIATPCYGGLVTESYLSSLGRTRECLVRQGIQIETSTFGNESLITRARNNLVAQFLGSDSEVLFFIDADIGWQPEAIKEILESRFDVAGIPYPLKGYDWQALQKLLDEKERAGSGSPLSARRLRESTLRFTMSRSFKQPSSLAPGWVKVDYLGTGFMAINRKAIEKMKEYYWETLNYRNDVDFYKKIARDENCVALFETMIDPVSRRYLSEDYAFCKRWTDIGGEIYACRKHVLTHTGSHSF